MAVTSRLADQAASSSFRDRMLALTQEHEDVLAEQQSLASLLGRSTLALTRPSLRPCPAPDLEDSEARYSNGIVGLEARHSNGIVGVRKEHVKAVRRGVSFEDPSATGAEQLDVEPVPKLSEEAEDSPKRDVSASDSIDVHSLSASLSEGPVSPRSQDYCHFKLMDCFRVSRGDSMFSRDSTSTMDDALWSEDIDGASGRTSGFERKATALRRSMLRRRQKDCIILYETHLCMDPSSPVRITWDALGVVTLLWDFIWIPLQVFDPPDIPSINLVNAVAMGYWNLDCLASFFTGYYRDGVLVTKPKLVVFAYLKRWLIFDVALITLDWVLLVMTMSSAARFGRSLRMVRFLRMIRLIRISKVSQMMTSVSEALYLDISVKFFNNLKLAITILLGNHLVACVWWLLGSETPPVGQSNWVERVLEWNDTLLANFWLQYTTCLLWSVTQLGFGTADDVQPANVMENVYSVAVVLMALFGVSTTVSTITNQMVQMQLSQTEAHFQFDMLRRFCRQNGVPREVSVRIYRFARTIFAQRQGELHLEKITIVNCLSRPLLAELRFWMFRDLFVNQPLFRLLSKSQGHIIHRIALEAVTVKEYAAGDVVFMSTERCEAMRCVEAGLLMYRRSRRTLRRTMSASRRASVGNSPGSEDGKELVKGQWMCEASLFTDWVHVGSLRTISNSAIVNVNPSSFASVMEKDIIAWRTCTDYSEGLLQRVNEDYVQGTLTDVDVVSMITASRGNLKINRSPMAFVKRKTVQYVANAKHKNSSRHDWG